MKADVHKTKQSLCWRIVYQCGNIFTFSPVNINQRKQLQTSLQHRIPLSQPWALFCPVSHWYIQKLGSSSSVTVNNSLVKGNFLHVCTSGDETDVFKIIINYNPKINPRGNQTAGNHVWMLTREPEDHKKARG